MSLLFYFVLFFLSYATLSDLHTMEVDNWVSYVPTIVVLLVYTSWASLLSFMVYFGIGYLLYLIGFWGGADVRLLGLIGSFSNGFNTIITFLSMMMLMGGIYGVCSYIIEPRSKLMPFVPSILASYLITFSHIYL